MYKLWNRNYLLILLTFLVSLLFLVPAAAQDETAPADIILLELRGVITSGQAAFIQRQLDELDPNNVQAVLILMDTPGGLVDATLDLNRAFGTVPVPVIVFVHPSGAIAASAGAFILVSSDIAAMAPGTTVGAAMPVALSPGGAEQAEEKTINFLAGHMRSLARQKGRPGDIAERFVTENLTLDSFEAEEQGIIDFTADNVTVLLEKLDGWEGEKGGRPFTLNTAGARLVEKEMILQERLQDKVSDPQIAFLLLMVGGMGLYFGLGMPGTIVPETLGGIALLLGIYGLGLFDTNTTGIIFIVLGFSLLVTEIFTAGFGILGIGGGVSLLIGAILLPSEPLMAADWYSSFRATAIGLALAVSVLSFLIVMVLIRSRRIWKSSGDFFAHAAKAIVIEELSPHGTVRMRGEYWKAYSYDGSTVLEGSEVDVLKQDGLTLIVRKPSPD
ncbi:MAG: nodulation protein NfeD [Bacillota bacterium]|nr:nodulation protein NfeD [Bacillota bacterium]